ncbi:hypothetical protein [Dehalobacter restrictus]|uniref:hypothetical protein n=1 Tax=Dehalobacter restrictus TaxID=55583 RepID=UPI001FA9FCA3|nr:hypothetical protein [Dehalobacter restrictus]
MSNKVENCQCCCSEETDQQKLDMIAEVIEKYKNREGEYTYTAPSLRSRTMDFKEQTDNELKLNSRPPHS